MDLNFDCHMNIYLQDNSLQPFFILLFTFLCMLMIKLFFIKKHALMKDNQYRFGSFQDAWEVDFRLCPEKERDVG